MRAAGIDIGSRTVKLAIIEDGQLLVTKKRETSFDPLAVCRELLAAEKYDCIVATGYGRHLFAASMVASVISEIKASAKAAHWLYPSCRTVIDIGGQDTKALSLDDAGRLLRFEMNDKCAAGTGRFIEMMALILSASVREFAALVSSAESGHPISSTCAVFSESEVVSLIARGVGRAEIARGIVDAVVMRTASLAKRVGLTTDVLFSGGVAFNHSIRDALAAHLRTPLIVPDDPQVLAAIGCALSATPN